MRQVVVPKKILLAVTGASGSIYGLRLLQCLLAAQQVSVSVIFSEAARLVLATETDLALPAAPAKARRLLLDYLKFPDTAALTIFAEKDWLAPAASGSAPLDAMVICPCSMGSIAAIAHGLSDNLLERAADVMLKERRRLIVVPREAPLSVIHLENLLTLARLGVVVIPASPSFYHKPNDINALVDSIVARILGHLEVPQDFFPAWGEAKL
jgi:4-hydroxy-3-polyprenylbenzoate decarboxylase